MKPKTYNREVSKRLRKIFVLFTCLSMFWSCFEAQFSGDPFQNSSGTTTVANGIPIRATTLPLRIQVAYNSSDDRIYWKLSWPGNDGMFHDYFRHDGNQWVKEGRGFREIGSEMLTEIVTDGDHDTCRQCHYVEVDANCANCHDTSGSAVRSHPGFASRGFGTAIAESRVAIAFANPIGQRLSGESTWVSNFDKYGCFLSCHGDNKDMPVWNASGKVSDHYSFMRLPSDPAYEFGVLDLWHWHAHRSGPLGYADDQFIKQIGRGGDNGMRTWTTQRIDDSGNPQLVFDPSTTTGGLYAFDYFDLFTTADYFFTQGLLDLPNDFDFGVASGAGYTPEFNDTVPRRLLTNPSGSRADIMAENSSYDFATGYWNVFMERDLVPATGDTDDGVTDDVRDVAFTDLSILYYVAFGVHTDHSSSRDHHVSFPFSLGFNNPVADLNAVEFSGAGIKPDFTNTGLFPVKIVYLFLPGLTSWDFLTGNELGTPVGGYMHGGFESVNAGDNKCISCHSVLESDPRTPATPGGSMELDILRRGGVYDATPISFFNHIKPILDTRCGTSGCHGEGTFLASGAFANVPVEQAHSTLVSNGTIDSTNPLHSLLLTKPLNEDPFSPHGGGAVFYSMQDPDYAKIMRWIVYGVPNN